MRWAYRGSAHVSALLVVSQGARPGVAKVTRTFGSLAPPKMPIRPFAGAPIRLCRAPFTLVMFGQGL
jgi:hypothetical protein